MLKKTVALFALVSSLALLATGCPDQIEQGKNMMKSEQGKGTPPPPPAE